MSSSPVMTGTTTAKPKQSIPTDVGLTPFEADRVRELVGREPNALEWAMFGAMWSEHCAYKHSKKLLRTLPTNGPRVYGRPTPGFSESRSRRSRDFASRPARRGSGPR